MTSTDVTGAVVMAAGRGSRLRPLTDEIPKPLLPIDGRPVIATLLRELAHARSAPSVAIVTGHLAEQVEELVGDGSGFGLRVRYVRQPEPLGSADAVRRALAAGAAAPVLVVAADTVFGAGDLARFVGAFAGSGAAGAMSGRRDPAPAPPHRFGLQIEAGRVVGPLDGTSSGGLSSAPLWAIGPELVPLLEELPGTPFELAELFRRGLARGVSIAGVELGPTRDLTFPVDLVRENFPYLGR